MKYLSGVSKEMEYSNNIILSGISLQCSTEKNILHFKISLRSTLALKRL